jgi:hypothetical protein
MQSANPRRAFRQWMRLTKLVGDDFPAAVGLHDLTIKSEQQTEIASLNISPVETKPLITPAFSVCRLEKIASGARLLLASAKRTSRRAPPFL